MSLPRHLTNIKKEIFGEISDILGIDKKRLTKSQLKALNKMNAEIKKNLNWIINRKTYRDNYYFHATKSPESLDVNILKGIEDNEYLDIRIDPYSVTKHYYYPQYLENANKIYEVYIADGYYLHREEKTGDITIQFYMKKTSRTIHDIMLSQYDNDESDRYHKLTGGGVVFDLDDSYVFKNKNRLEKILNILDRKYFFLKKVYKSRLFPPMLKHLIFTRDKFKCQICNKHKSQLNDDICLEVDHIKAWIDGGETTYHNGQTLCSLCNKAKHHSKKFYEVKK